MFTMLNNTPLNRLMMLGAAAGGGKAVEAEAQGNPLSFLTDLSKPLKSLLIPFTPKQTGSGDPSPSNVRPIVPWDGLTVWNGGKNLLDKTNVINGNFSSSGSNTVISKNDNSRIVCMPCQPNTTYTCSKMTGGQRFSAYCSEEEPETGVVVYPATSSTGNTSVRKVVTSSNAKYLCLFVWLSTVDTEISAQDMIDSVMVEAGDVTPSAYEPYKPITETSISFTSHVYGGTLDVVSGVLTVEWKEIVKTWGDFTNKTSLGDNTRGTLNISSYPSKQSSEAVDAKCNIAPRNTGWSTDSVHFYTNEGSCIVFLPNDTDASTEIQVVYPLATSQEIQLTPQQITALVGNNTIWSDADGQLTAVYLKKA